MHYKTIFISDLHLGGPCNYKALHDFLRDTDADLWYIVGDCLDFWAIKHSRSWPNEASVIVQKLLRKARKGQRIIILPGNHDSDLRQFEAFEFGNIEFKETAIHECGGRRYLVLHGDVLDSVIGHAEWLARIGAVAYDWLIALNNSVNWSREILHLPQWSFSAAIKRVVKSAVSYISDFENSLAELARSRGADGIICGHIHTPVIKQINGVTYVNCGDFVESRTAVVEIDGELELRYY